MKWMMKVSFPNSPQEQDYYITERKRIEKTYIGFDGKKYLKIVKTEEHRYFIEKKNGYKYISYERFRELMNY